MKINLTSSTPVTTPTDFQDGFYVHMNQYIKEFVKVHGDHYETWSCHFNSNEQPTAIFHMHQFQYTPNIPEIYYKNLTPISEEEAQQFLADFQTALNLRIEVAA